MMKDFVYNFHTVSEVVGITNSIIIHYKLSTF